MRSLFDTCYHLPWKESDNPNGWIEPTTLCQLACPGCYRGVDKRGHSGEHQHLREMISQVDYLIENRNIHTLSIAGGEPLLYPDLIPLIGYARKKGLRVMLYSNGIGLDEAYLRELKDAGTTQVLIHVDKFQNRTPSNSSEELIRERINFCDMFRKVGGVNLGFIQPLSKACLEDLPAMTRFFNSNRDIISLVVFTLYREICWNHERKPLIDTSITIGEVAGHLQEAGVFMPAAFLPAVKNKPEPAWLFSFSIGSKKTLLGFFDGNVYRFLQERYYRRKGRHLFISRQNRVGIGGLVRLVRFRAVRAIMKHWLFGTKDTLFFQTYLIIRGPVKTNGEWDLCEGCPDAMLHEGRLVPSCILEEIKSMH